MQNSMPDVITAISSFWGTDQLQTVSDSMAVDNQPLAQNLSTAKKRAPSPVHDPFSCKRPRVNSMSSKSESNFSDNLDLDSEIEERVLTLEDNMLFFTEDTRLLYQHNFPKLLTSPIARLQWLATNLLYRSDPESNSNSSRTKIQNFIADLLDENSLYLSDLWLWSSDDISLLTSPDSAVPEFLCSAIKKHNNFHIIPLEDSETVDDRMDLLDWLFILWNRYDSEVIGLWGLIQQWHGVADCICQLGKDSELACCPDLTFWINQVAHRLYPREEILSACSHLGLCSSCTSRFFMDDYEQRICFQPSLSLIDLIGSLQWTIHESAIQCNGPPIWTTLLVASWHRSVCISEGPPSFEGLLQTLKALPDSCRLSGDASEWLENHFSPSKEDHWLECFPRQWRLPICLLRRSEWLELINATISDSSQHCPLPYSIKKEIKIKWFTVTLTLFEEGNAWSCAIDVIDSFTEVKELNFVDLQEPGIKASLLTIDDQQLEEEFEGYSVSPPLHCKIPLELAFQSPKLWLHCTRASLQTLFYHFSDSSDYGIPLCLDKLVSQEVTGFHISKAASVSAVDALATYASCRDSCLKSLKELQIQSMPYSFNLKMLSAILYDDVLSVCAGMSVVLQTKHLYKDLWSRKGHEAQSLLNLLHQLLDLPGIPTRVQTDFTQAVIRLSKASNLHPECLILNGLQKIGLHPVAAGAFGEVWKGIIRGQEVSVKVVKIYLEQEVEALLKAFYHEAILWSQLSHPNILPLYGIYFLDNMHSRLCLVSPWMSHGNIKQYLKSAPSNLKVILLILDIAQGLKYLHHKRIVHGDLKGVNILATPLGRACIMDFGLSTIADSQILNWTSLSTASARGGTARWQGPELLSGGCNSFAGDVYAFACVCYEIFTGRHPFPELNDMAVALKVIQGARPSRPSSAQLSDSMWELMQDCWKAEPNERPTASEVAHRIENLPEAANIGPAHKEWDESFPKTLRTSLRHEGLIPSMQELKVMFPGIEE